MSKKSVITISETELPRVVERLSMEVLKSGFVPEAIVGIASGGAIVAQHFSPTLDCLRVTCAVRRPGTKVKVAVPGLSAVLRHLPLGVADRLRRTEDWFGTHLARSPMPRDLEDAVELPLAALRDVDLARILIVDDAVDSGATLASVAASVRRLAPRNVDIRTCAITRTRSSERSLIVPDFFVFDQVLCRFHWASDYRERS